MSKFSEILNFTLLEVGKYKLSVVDLVIISIILLVTQVFLKVLKHYILKSVKDDEDEKGRKLSIFILLRYFIWTLSIIISLQVIGLPITILLASLSALLVGFGLGIQNIFNDIVSGIFLLFEGTIQIGDVVQIDDMVCQIEEISLRTSKAKTRDDITIIIPNRHFINDKVINWSRQHTREARFHLKVGVSYSANPHEVKKILTDVMLSHPDILKDKKYQPFVRFVEYADSAIVFDMIFWSKRTFRIENVKSDLLFNTFDKLKENNIEIPFPQRDIHLRSSDVALVANK